MSHTLPTSPLAPQASRGIRLAGLDLLRVLAVFLVFGRHLAPLSAAAPRFFLTLTNTWNCGGWVGVDLFFVLSGFLVSGLLFADYQRNGRLHVFNFLFRRAFKIYPAYYVYLAVSIFVGSRLFFESPTTRQLTAHIFFYQNYDPEFLEYWGHLWTLALEEHFYLGLAIVMFIALQLLKKKPNPFSWIPPAFLAVAIGVLAYRCYHSSGAPFDYFADILPTHLRFDSFFFGVLLSYYYHFADEKFLSIARTYRLFLFAFGIAGLAPAFIFNLTDRFTYTFGFTLYYLAAGALITAVLVTRFPHRNPFVRLFSYLGARSYSIYVWHLLIFMTTAVCLGKLHKYAFAHYWITYAAGGIFFALLLGAGLSELIEFPALKLRNFLFPRPAGTSAVTVPTAGTQSNAEPVPALEYIVATTQSQ